MAGAVVDRVDGEGSAVVLDVAQAVSQFLNCLFLELKRRVSSMAVVPSEQLSDGALKVTASLFDLWHILRVTDNCTSPQEVVPMMISLFGGLVLGSWSAPCGSIRLPFLADAGMNEVANIMSLGKAKR